MPPGHPNSKGSMVTGHNCVALPGAVGTNARSATIDAGGNNVFYRLANP